MQARKITPRQNSERLKARTAEFTELRFSHAFCTNVEMLSCDIFIDTRFDIYTNDLYENATRTKKSQKITGEEPDISLVT